MAEASGSRTPPRSQQTRSRTPTAASGESQSTPSRISRLFSFGSASGAVSRSEEGSKDAVAVNGDANALLWLPDSSSSSSLSTGGQDINATISHGASGARPSTPTPITRRGSQGGRTQPANDNLATPQRRNSRGSFLSAMLAGPSDSHSTSKGEDLTTPSRPGTVPRLANDASTSSWRLPWTSPKKKPALQPIAGIVAASQPDANSFGSVGLTMNGDIEDPDSKAATPNETNASNDEVLDEGISMSDTSGKVDFLTSLPLELSLYVLLFADVQTISRAMQVSPTWHTIASDALIWRDHFYRNPGWEVQHEILETGHMSMSASQRGVLGSATTPSKQQTPSQPRSRRSATVTSDGSIAARIGRRITDIVSDIGFMTLHRDRMLQQEASAEDEAPAPVQTEEAVPIAGPSTEVERSLSRSASRAGTPSRTRSSTATSSAATHPSNFYRPLRSSMRQQSAPGNPTPSRRGSQSFSIVQSLLETHGSPNLHGLPLGPQILREGDHAHSHTHPHFASEPFAHETSTTFPPRPDSALKHRRVSTGTFSPYQSLMSPMKEFEPNASLFLDWRGLYRDRLELERRWQDGRFTNRILKGHTDSVYCIALSGDMLISGSRDQTIKVWNTATGTLKRTIEAHTASVLAIQYDGKIMVTGASNGELYVWDTNTWEVTDILEGHTMGVLDVQMNDKWIVSCSKDTSIRVWRKDTKEAYRVLQGHRGPVNAIQLHEDKICSASGDSLAKLWNIESGQVMRVFKGHERGLACVQYDGYVLATGSNDKTIRIWDPNTGECTKVLKGHKDLVRTLSYDPVRRRLFSGSYDKTTRLWDLESGNLKMTFKTSHKSLVFDVTMDVSRLVSCSHDQRIVVIDFGEELNAHRFV